MDGGTQQREPGDLNLHYHVDDAPVGAAALGGRIGASVALVSHISADLPWNHLILIPLLGLANHVLFDRG
jgi:hypothetical protein